MPIYIRKISRAKWQKGHSEGSIPSDANADAITGCTRTSDNTLSLWKIDEENMVNEAVLALATSLQRLDGFDVLLMDDNQIEGVFKLEQTSGNTPIEDLKDKHYDILELKHSSLGTISDVIINQLNKNRVLKFSRSQVKALINTAIKDNRLSKEQLNTELVADL